MICILLLAFFVVVICIFGSTPGCVLAVALDREGVLGRESGVKIVAAGPRQY